MTQAENRPARKCGRRPGTAKYRPLEENATFGEKLRWQMDMAGLSSDRLAEMVGASGPSIRAYTTGRYWPSLDMAARIARALDVSLDWLAGMEG